MLHDVLFCSGVASRRRHWPPTIRQHRGARLVEGGVAEDADPKPSPHIEWLGGGVYCREQEARVRRKREEGGGWCLSYCTVLPSVSVCLSSHCRNQFALCGTVDTERGKGVQTQPGHMQAGTSNHTNS